MENGVNSFTVAYDNFNIKHILECGQVFRYGIFDNNYYVISQNHLAFVTNTQKNYQISTTNEKYFKKYFDFSNNYDIINEYININPLMGECIRFGQGLRLLNQDPFETLISFIISQQNNIPRIKGIIEKMCAALGEKRNLNGFSYYAFPSLESMLKCNEDFFTSLGLGYRAGYIVKTVAAIADGFPLYCLHDMQANEAKEKLLQLSGVGEKVADCVLLFAFKKSSVFPVDVWMEKVYNDYFFNGKKNRTQIAEYFRYMFKEYSGYAQQYLYYYKRELK